MSSGKETVRGKGQVPKGTQSFTFPVEKGKIMEFARAVHDDNPIYMDAEYAAKTALGGIIAPPTFAESARVFSGEPGAETPADEEMIAMSLDGAREYEYLEPVYAGDVLTGDRKPDEVYEKAGRRGGKMKFIVSETVFTNQNGRKVLVLKSTKVQLGRPVAEQLGVPGT